MINLSNIDLDKAAAAAKKMGDHLKKMGITSSIKKSRYQTQIRALEISYAGDLPEFFTKLKINGLKIQDLSPIDEKSISGKYKAKLVSTVSSAGGLTGGEEFLVVNTFTDRGSLKTKDLAPEKFGLTQGNFKSKSQFDTSVENGIKKNSRIPEHISKLLMSLYMDVTKNTTTRDKIPMSIASKTMFSALKPADRQAIGKDFGEVLSMRWYITQKFASTWTECGFSSISNEALVDFIVKLKEGSAIVTKQISAKFEAGAAPSIKAIVDNTDEVYKRPTGEQKKTIDVLKALASKDSNTSTKILAAMKSIDHPAYLELTKIIGKKNMTIADISKKIQEIASMGDTPTKRIALFNAKFANFYKILKKNASSDSIAVVFSKPTFKKYYSLVMAPMGYALVDYMNKQEIYQEVLNSISQHMKTEQVYLNFSTDSMIFNKKLFSGATFKFAYGANAKDSDNTGIKFSMKH